MTAESILKRVYADKKKQPQHQEKVNPSIYKGARCKVCLIKENDQLPPVLINNANKVYELVKDELATADRETLLSIMLDTSLHLIGIETVAIGSINACGSKVSEIFKSAILSNASHASYSVTTILQDRWNQVLKTLLLPRTLSNAAFY